MKSNLKLLMLAATAAGLIVLQTAGAKADAITLGPSQQIVGIASQGTGGSGSAGVNLTLGFCASFAFGMGPITKETCTLSGPATVDSNGMTLNGTYSLTSSNGSGPVMAQALETFGVFNVQLNSGTLTTFTFSLHNEKMLSGAVTYGRLINNGSNPIFDGTWDVNGRSLPFSFTLASLCGSVTPCSVSVASLTLALTGEQAAAAIASGTFYTATPEPASLSLYGAGLIVIGLAFRRRIRVYSVRDALVRLTAAAASSADLRS